MIAIEPLVRILNLALASKGPSTHDVMADELTPNDIGDVSRVPDLSEQIDGGVVSLIADGAYDVQAVYDALAE